MCWPKSSSGYCSFPVQTSDSQRVDPLGSWMDFVKRPVGNFPGKCRKRKRPLVNAHIKIFTFNDH